MNISPARQRNSIHESQNHWVTSPEDRFMNPGTILLMVLILLLIGAFPTWPYSQSWGYYPSVGLGLVLVIIVILLLSGKL